MNAHQKLLSCPQQTFSTEEEEEKELSPVQAVRAACPKRSVNSFCRAVTTDNNLVDQQKSNVRLSICCMGIFMYLTCIYIKLIQLADAHLGL